MTITKKNLKPFFKAAIRCTEHIQAQEYKRASTLAIAKKKVCKSIILADKNATPLMKKAALIFGICFKALEEFSELISTVSNQNWIYNLNKVRRTWFLLQNCNERFESVLPTLQFEEDLSKFIMNSLQDIEQQINKKYENGLYVSPEVIIENCVCSICKQGVYSCPHIPNQVYNGEICRMIPTAIKPGGGIIITSNPKDKRCRIWEIQDDPDGKGPIAKNVPFLISFRTDDFLYDESNGYLACDFNFICEFDELQKQKKLLSSLNPITNEFE